MSRGACTPEQRASCPLTEHFTDLHHTYYPRRKYLGSVANQFRTLPENKEQLCRNEHNEIHANEPIPERPSIQDMLAAIAISEAPLKGAAA